MDPPERCRRGAWKQSASVLAGENQVDDHYVMPFQLPHVVVGFRKIAAGPEKK